MPDMILPDLSDHLDGKRLILPIRGKRYIVPEATGEQFLRLQRLGAALMAADSPSSPAAGEFNQLAPADMNELVLGKDVLAQMVKNNLTGSEIDRAATAAFFWHIGQGEAVVEAAFLGSGKARSPRKRGTTKPTTRTAAATTTRSRASGSGTSTRRK